MAHEQVFGKRVDSEQVFVLQCRGSEQVFGQGDAMSVAFELEYEVFRPQLSLVVDRPPQSAARRQFLRRRMALAAFVAALLVLLALPIAALGGKTIAGAAPTPGHVYVVQSGDTLASIAQRVDAGQAAAVAQQLAREAGSFYVVPGEHLLIP
jgi:LysM domain